MNNSILFVAAAVVTTAVSTYYFAEAKNADEGGSSPEIKNMTGANSETVEAVTRVLGTLETYQAVTQRQLEHAENERAHLNATLTALSGRMGSIETALRDALAPGELRARAFEAEPDTVIDTAHAVGKSASRHLSEADFSHRIDESLSAGSNDPRLTALVTEQATAALSKVHGVDLAGMQCNPKVCRATFVHAAGREDDIQDLIGAPPFLHEGFTIVDAEGRTVLYFIQPGATLAQLRDDFAE